MSDSQAPTTTQGQTSEAASFQPTAMPEHANAGSVMIEAQRATAEAQGKMVIAKQFPRNEAKAHQQVIEACRSLAFAETASFSYKRGGSNVSGPTIRLAELLARCWGNIEFGIRELSQRVGETEMEAWAWDVENNVATRQAFVVKHIRDKRGGGTKLTEQRDIYEIGANMGARRLRARIMALLPPDYIEAAVAECNNTLQTGGDGKTSIKDRVRQMVGRFETIGVTIDMLEKHLGHKVDDTLPEEFAELHQIFRSIKDGYSEAREWFGGEEKSRKQLDALAADQEDEAKDDAAAEPEPNKDEDQDQF